MARASDRLPENAPGDYFVDRSCIDCDVCRQIAAEVFARSGREGQSFVLAQPDGAASRRRAAMALVSCPTASIGTASKEDVAGVADAFPEPVEDEVAFCGYTSESAFGASSYFVQRAGGNLLVDSPRAAAPLIRRLEAQGGVALMFLTHRDDVADHRVFHERFGCRRILHRDDVSAGTREVEEQPEGDEPRRIAEDILLIPVPGHTRGSAALLYRGRFLFTGDHLWGDDEDAPRLSASRSVCWYSWREQTRSMERLLDYEFEWVLPGHGRRFRAGSAAQMRRELQRLITWMRR